MWSGIIKSVSNIGFRLRPERKPPDVNQVQPAPDPEVPKVFEVQVRLKYHALERTLPSVLPLLDKIIEVHSGEVNCFHALMDRIVEEKPFHGYQALFDCIPPLQASTRNIRLLEIQGYIETYLVILPYHILLRWPQVLFHMLAFTIQVTVRSLVKRSVIYLWLKFCATKEELSIYKRYVKSLKHKEFRAKKKEKLIAERKKNEHKKYQRSRFTALLSCLLFLSTATYGADHQWQSQIQAYVSADHGTLQTEKLPSPLC
jgi:hypothetical protein